MADQVSPLGGLAAGILQAQQVVAKPPPAPEKSASKNVADPQSKDLEGRRVDAPVQDLEVAATTIQDYFKNAQSDLKFSVDKDTGRLVFKIVNSATQEVIRQVPSEEVLSMARKLRALSDSGDASGVLMDKQG